MFLRHVHGTDHNSNFSLHSHFIAGIFVWQEGEMVVWRVRVVLGTLGNAKTGRVGLLLSTGG